MSRRDFSPRGFVVSYVQSASSIAGVLSVFAALIWLLGGHVTGFGLGHVSMAHGGATGSAPRGFAFVGIAFMASLGGWLSAYWRYFVFPEGQRILLLGVVPGSILPNLAALIAGAIQGATNLFSDPLLWLQSLAGLSVGSVMVLYGFTLWDWMTSKR